MQEIGRVNKVYWNRNYFNATKFEDQLFIKVELLDRIGTYAEMDFDDELKISIASGLLTFGVLAIEFENDHNEYSKILLTAQLIDEIDSKVNFKNKVAFANKLINARVYKEV